MVSCLELPSGVLWLGQGSVLALEELCLNPHPRYRYLWTVRTQEGQSSHQASITDVVGKEVILDICLRQGLRPLSEGSFRIGLYRTS